jgi:polyisoprenoid-binding protein YceI
VQRCVAKREPRAASRGRLFTRLCAGACLCAGLMTLGSCTALRVVTHSVDVHPLDAPAGHYTLDPRHYSLLFDVDHLHYIRFVSRFDRVQATLQFDPNWTQSQSHVEARIEAASVDTNVPILDKMVSGEQMFDAQHYPQIAFSSTSFQPTGPTTATLSGQLTIRDKSIPLTLEVVFNGAAPDPLTRVPTLGFAANGHFSRAALGLNSWFPAIGDDVHVSVQAEFVKTD